MAEPELSRARPPALGPFLAGEIDALIELHQFRRRVVVQPLDATHVEIDGSRYVNFASNNYLGLTHHPHVLAEAQRVLRSSGLGSGAAALITGHTPEHAAAEAAIADWKGTEAALLLPSGYQANHAAVQALSAIGERRGGVRFLIDKLAHASLIDAVRATGNPFRVFPHNGMEKLTRLLTDASPLQLQVVVTESIFSMDGDSADLQSLIELKHRHGFVLLLDEAHGSGVYGPKGAGLAAEMGFSAEIDLTVITLSKSLGVCGGAICASRAWCDAVVNFGRAYLFSTSIPPMIAAAARAAVEVMSDEPHHQQRVRQLARRVRQELTAAGRHLPAGDSPIIPVILGSESAALQAALHLRSRGMVVPAIRPPTVARGSSRLRVTLSSAHTDAEVNQLLEGLGEVG